MGNHWARQKLLQGIGGDSSILESGNRIALAAESALKSEHGLRFPFADSYLIVKNSGRVVKERAEGLMPESTRVHQRTSLGTLRYCFRPFYFSNIKCGCSNISGVRLILILAELQTCALSQQLFDGIIVIVIHICLSLWILMDA